jgi:hypothetical protein
MTNDEIMEWKAMGYPLDILRYAAYWAEFKAGFLDVGANI